MLKVVSRACNGGLDPNRLDDLDIIDFIKLDILNKYSKG